MRWLPVTRQAPGLLALLGLKNNGSNPFELDSAMQPTLDLRDWLLASAQEQVVGQTVGYVSAGGTANFMAFTTTPLVVPRDEIWFVWDYAVTLNVGALDTLYGQVLASALQQPGDILLGATNPGVFGAPGTQIVCPTTPRRFFLGGTEFGFGHGTYTTGGAGVSANMTVTKIRV